MHCPLQLGQAPRLRTLPHEEQIGLFYHLPCGCPGCCKHCDKPAILPLILFSQVDIGYTRSVMTVPALPLPDKRAFQMEGLR
jgi:hypothetical protein